MFDTSTAIAIAGLQQNHDRDIASWKRAYKELEQNYDEFVFRARNDLHQRQAALQAHRGIEAALLAALAELDPNHSLLPDEATDKIFFEKLEEALYDPKIIKKTFPSGNLPDGIPIKKDGNYLLYNGT